MRGGDSVKCDKSRGAREARRPGLADRIDPGAVKSRFAAALRAVNFRTGAHGRHSTHRLPRERSQNAAADRRTMYGSPEPVVPVVRVG
jgi:hypothetical protein